MWAFVQIPLIPTVHLGAELQQELIEILPDGDRKGKYFAVTRRRIGDPRVQAVLNALERGGFSPAPARKEPNSKEYRLSIFRRYRAEELARCEYLKLRAQKYDFNNGRMTDEGAITLQPEAIKEGADSVVLSDEEILVPDRVRRVIEASDLKRVLFRPIVVRERWWDKDSAVIPWDRFGEPWWEITSDLILPRVSPSTTLVDKDGEPYIEGASRGCILVEDHYVEPQLLYRRQDLESVGPFDIGVSHERFGIGRPHEGQRCKVVSNRFLRFWREHGLKATWIPVRLEG